MDANLLKQKEKRYMLMKRFHKNLHPLAIEYLYEGLVLTESIYNYNGRTMLLPKGEVLDEYKIWKLKKFNHDYRNICVHTKTFQELIIKSIPVLITRLAMFLLIICVSI